MADSCRVRPLSAGSVLSSDRYTDHFFASKNKNNCKLNSNSCALCNKSFGVRKRHRKRSCKRCQRKICEDCSIQKRYDFSTKQLVRVCDCCTHNEHVIRVTHRINNLKLKSQRHKGIYIAKTAQTSPEFRHGFVSNSRIVEINSLNVESCSAQQIASKLNLIKLPFTVLLDYSEAMINVSDLQALLDNKGVAHSKSVSLSADNVRPRAESKSNSTPASPKLCLSGDDDAISVADGDDFIGPPDAIDLVEYNALMSSDKEHMNSKTDQHRSENGYGDGSARSLASETMQTLPAATQNNKNTVTAAPRVKNKRCLRQFCVALSDYNFDLCLQFRNGYHQHHQQRQPRSVNCRSSWAWYTVSVNGTNLNVSNLHQLHRLLSTSRLPIVDFALYF
mmetsp:Transcript_40662/g.66832  ORF Transcript_40662/g.66832 Transcript_40662/m.66832 type:complete len:391 (+) Transcript_40662:33-1205(+)